MTASRGVSGEYDAMRGGSKEEVGGKVLDHMITSLLPYPYKKTHVKGIWWVPAG